MRAAVAPMIVLAVGGLAPARAEACPTWPERQTMACMRGYVRLEPGALAIGVKKRASHVESHGLGFQTGLGAGGFLRLDNFAFAVGVRAVYAVYPRAYGTTSFPDHYLHVGPELRFGHARERVFVYGLLRGGFSGWRMTTMPRTSIAPDRSRGGHFGVGVGVWGRVGRRLLVGGEIALDAVWQPYEAPRSAVLLALSLGAWL